MRVGSTTDRQDMVRWIRTHDVRWELAPRDELVQGRGLQQTGYVLRLFGRLPLPGRKGSERLVETIHQRLHAMATEALRVVPPDFRVDVQSLSRVVVTRTSTFTVDVELTAVGSPAHLDDARPPEEQRRLIGVLEAKLRSMGLRKNPELSDVRIWRRNGSGG